MNDIYLTVKNPDGEIMPIAVLWATGKMQKFHQPDIDKYMKRAGDEYKLVKVKITEIL